MRKPGQIEAEVAQAAELPELEREAKRWELLVEVLLDIREKLDVIESYSIHIEGHTEVLRQRFR